MPSTPDNVAFFRAVRAGDVEQVERYLAEGASPNTKTFTGRPSLHMATSPLMIRLLVEAGADLEARDQRELTALETACDGEIEAVRTLIELGADVNALHDRGYSTLMVAVSCRRRTPEIVRPLIDHGADPLHVSDLGFTPLHAWVSVPWQERYAADEILKILLAEGVDLEAREGRGFTAFLLALCDGTTEEASMLLQSGADPFKRVEHPQADGYLHSATALMLAVRSPELVEALLQAGVDTRVTYEDGTTALDWAQTAFKHAEDPDEKSSLARSIALLEGVVLGTSRSDV
jgi:ankyrin repeat protein